MYRIQFSTKWCEMLGYVIICHMKPIISLGEALIDFVPHTIGVRLPDVESFSRKPGGAPANVAAATAKLGANVYFIGKVGKDAFGEAIQKALSETGVKTDFLSQTDISNTTLAFVSLKANGERDFAFYRDRSADLLLEKDDIPLHLLSEATIFHFGSLSLTDEPSRTTTLFAAQEAKARGCVISYDPNLRPPLWTSLAEAKERILQAMSLADLVKLNEEELIFLTDSTDVNPVTTPDLDARAKQLFKEYRFSCLLVTLGAKGCFYITEKRTNYVRGMDVEALDTTGAGDAFVGGMLFQIAPKLQSRNSLHQLLLQTDEWERSLRFANSVAALSTTRYGAIDSYPSLSQVEQFMCVQKLR